MAAAARGQHADGGTLLSLGEPFSENISVNSCLLSTHPPPFRALESRGTPAPFITSLARICAMEK